MIVDSEFGKVESATIIVGPLNQLDCTSNLFQEGSLCLLFEKRNGIPSTFDSVA